jgi:DNA-binding XRE family transcriptional regulator
MNMGGHARRRAPTSAAGERDTLIRARCAAGVSQAELAREFGITYQRVHQIVRGRGR